MNNVILKGTKTFLRSMNHIFSFKLKFSSRKKINFNFNVKHVKHAHTYGHFQIGCKACKAFKGSLEGLIHFIQFTNPWVKKKIYYYGFWGYFTF